MRVRTVICKRDWVAEKDWLPSGCDDRGLSHAMRRRHDRPHFHLSLAIKMPRLPDTATNSTAFNSNKERKGSTPITSTATKLSAHPQLNKSIFELSQVCEDLPPASDGQSQLLRGLTTESRAHDYSLQAVPFHYLREARTEGFATEHPTLERHVAYEQILHSLADTIS